MIMQTMPMISRVQRFVRGPAVDVAPYIAFSPLCRPRGVLIFALRLPESRHHTNGPAGRNDSKRAREEDSRLAREKQRYLIRNKRSWTPALRAFRGRAPGLLLRVYSGRRVDCHATICQRPPFRI